MKNKVYASTISIILVCLLFSGVSAFGEDIKARMKARLPIIVKLKSEGIVGENSAGFLQFIGNQKSNETVIAEENADRLKVYEAIAKKTGTTPEVVGQRRAKQIAEKAGPGEWLRDTNGKWYQKK